jgi:hypothetical protein
MFNSLTAEEIVMRTEISEEVKNILAKLHLSY